MRTILFFCGALTLLTLQSCQPDNREKDESEKNEVNTKQETPVKMIESLVGDWQLASPPVTADQQADADQTMTFTEEARFALHAGNQKIDSGAYRMNEQLRSLYLESEGNKDPREFEIDLKGDSLILSPKDSPREVKYIYRKKV